MLVVEAGEEIQPRSLVLGREVFGRRTQVEDGVARRAEHRALVGRRQIARAPIVGSVIGAAAMVEQDHERRQVLVLGPETVRGPRPVTGRAREHGAGVPLEMRDRVVVRAADGRPDQRNIIHHASDMREQFGDFDAGLPVLLEPVRAAHDGARKSLLDLDLPLARQRLAVVFVERGFGIEGVDMAYAAAHEQ